MKWGILGGTFDPIHLGHLRCAEEIGELFALDKVLFVPASRPPHKENAAITPFRHRENMVRLAISGNSAFSFSDIENRRDGISYSIDTVETLVSEGHGELELYFIAGLDAFRLVRTWKDWKRLLRLCNFIVMTRPGSRGESLADILTPDFAGLFTYDDGLKGFKGPSGHCISFRQVSYLDISSSDIRERVRVGKSIRYLVPDPVLAYIDKQGCYRP
jgi:nicotinate-nucleotide adenylyltransferase